MEDHPSKIFPLLGYLPEMPVVEMETSPAESPLDLVISDECRQSLDSSKKTNKRKRSTKTKKTRGKRKPMLEPPILKLQAMPEMLRRKIREMGGVRIVLVVQKQLTHTDVSRVNSRLSIPRGQLIFEFLSKDEEAGLDEYEGNSKTKAGIKALVIDPRLEEMEVSFKKWEMDKACVFNMIHNWNDLVEENGLQAGHTIQVWSFRKEERRATVGSDLCFALVKLEEEEGHNDGGAAEANAAIAV